MPLTDPAEGAAPSAPSAVSATALASPVCPVPAQAAHPPLLATVSAQPSSRIHADGPWISGRFFSVLPPSPLAPITDLDQTWYAVIKGRYVGVTPDNALDGAATVRVSGAGHKGYTTQAAALTAFNRALEGNLVVVSLVDRLVVIYPTTETIRSIIPLAMKPQPLTLSEPGLLDSLLDSPDTCERCLKPNFKHAAIPGATFTILISCPHRPDPDYPLYRNKAVAKILPDSRQHQTCMGNLLVVKHALVADPNVSNANLPVIDVASSDLPYLDELVRRLTLEESAQYEVLQRPSPTTPPPDYAEIGPRNSAPHTPTARPRHPSIPASSSSPSSSSPTVYRFSSPPQTSYYADWSQAATLTQASPHSTVHAVRKKSKPRSKKAAYVVFRGRQIGKAADAVRTATSGVQFTLHQRYTTVDEAHAAFDIATSNGWTCVSNFWTATPVLPSQAPLPLSNEPSDFDGPSLHHRSIDDPWYVVYAGVNPGVFATSVECALNVLGIQSSLHERATSYAEAVAKFERATTRGEVRVHRARVA
ncbi:hypothetical protein C8F04DRAFT_1260479 [Mycena alexandri]|uniref:Uncharacterized protein n=1 Tax=Mycena alexandri TaxID=1745969 RepID=A0AAD6X297_9AGAR|nr:hypothetical protein C8F04DRAFT_1260479 [Mycena alexandri]